MERLKWKFQTWTWTNPTLSLKEVSGSRKRFTIVGNHTVSMPPWHVAQRRTNKTELSEQDTKCQTQLCLENNLHHKAMWIYLRNLPKYDWVYTRHCKYLNKSWCGVLDSQLSVWKQFVNKSSTETLHRYRIRKFLWKSEAKQTWLGPKVKSLQKHSQ